MSMVRRSCSTRVPIFIQIPIVCFLTLTSLTCSKSFYFECATPRLYERGEEVMFYQCNNLHANPNSLLFDLDLFYPLKRSRSTSFNCECGTLIFNERDMNYLGTNFHTSPDSPLFYLELFDLH